MLQCLTPIIIALRKIAPEKTAFFEPFTCNVYRSIQPQNMHMCKQFLGKVSTAKMFFENQTDVVMIFPSLKMNSKSMYFPMMKHTGKIVAP